MSHGDEYSRAAIARRAFRYHWIGGKVGESPMTTKLSDAIESSETRA